MKSTRVLSVSWLATAVLAGVAGTLFWLAGKNDPANYGTAIDEVQKIQQLAADWSIEAARVRADPLADFDSLAAFIPRMGDLKQNLLATVPAIPEVPDRLVNAASAFVNAVDAREERIERFKTGYAIIRNSARYLPLAAATIVQTPGVDAELSREISVLTNDINGYLTVAERQRQGAPDGQYRAASSSRARPGTAVAGQHHQLHRPRERAPGSTGPYGGTVLAGHIERDHGPGGAAGQ